MNWQEATEQQKQQQQNETNFKFNKMYCLWERELRVFGNEGLETEEDEPSIVEILGEAILNDVILETDDNVRSLPLLQPEHKTAQTRWTSYLEGKKPTKTLNKMTKMDLMFWFNIFNV